jgi:hypothetical protein
LRAQSIFNKWSEIELAQDVSFDDFSSTLQMDEENYILTLRFRLEKLIIFFKWNPIDIHTNSYEKNVGKKNINV